MDTNYERVVEKIAKVAGLQKEEIERRVEAKRAKLSGLISKDGAAQIIAAELGVSFDDEKLKIDELLPGMRKVNVVGKVVNLFPIRTFTTKKGDEGKVSNFILADETSNIKVVLWDTNHIGLIESGTVATGGFVEIKNAAMRDNELHLGSFSEFKPSSEIIASVKTEKIVKEKSIVNFRVSDAARVRAFIVQTFEPRFFYVCPECKKKVVSGSDGFICQDHGKIGAEKRALINVVLDDGTETMRAVAFHEILNPLGITDLEHLENLIVQREALLGKEMIFSGNVRTNKFFNNPEFIIDQIKDVDFDEVILSLEKPGN
jgi:replication factor A1